METGTLLSILALVGLGVFGAILYKVWGHVKKWNPVGMASRAYADEINKKADASRNIAEQVLLTKGVLKKTFQGLDEYVAQLGTKSNELKAELEELKAKVDALPAGTAPTGGASAEDLAALSQTVKELCEQTLPAYWQAITDLQNAAPSDAPAPAAPGLTRAEVEKIVRETIPHETKTTAPVAVPPPTMSARMRKEVEDIVQGLLPHEMPTRAPLSVPPPHGVTNLQQGLRALLDFLQIRVGNGLDKETKALEKEILDLQTVSVRELGKLEQVVTAAIAAVKAARKHRANNPDCPLSEIFDELEAVRYVESLELTFSEGKRVMDTLETDYDGYRKALINQAAEAQSQLDAAQGQLNEAKAALNSYQNFEIPRIQEEIDGRQSRLAEIKKVRNLLTEARNALKRVHEAPEAAASPLLNGPLPRPSAPPVRSSSPPLRSRQPTLSPPPGPPSGTAAMAPVAIPAAPPAPTALLPEPAAPAAGDGDSPATIVDPDEPDVTAESEPPAAAAPLLEAD